MLGLKFLPGHLACSQHGAGPCGDLGRGLSLQSCSHCGSGSQGRRPGRVRGDLKAALSATAPAALAASRLSAAFLAAEQPLCRALLSARSIFLLFLSNPTGSGGPGAPAAGSAPLGELQGKPVEIT